MWRCLVYDSAVCMLLVTGELGGLLCTERRIHIELYSYLCDIYRIYRCGELFSTSALI